MITIPQVVRNIDTDRVCVRTSCHDTKLRMATDGQNDPMGCRFVHQKNQLSALKVELQWHKPAQDRQAWRQIATVSA